MPIDAPGDNAERIRRAIVLRAASLEVDQIDPDQFNVRRLRNGRLVGPVTLRSTVKTAEGDQELRVVGSDVDLTEEGIWTPNDVNFRLGPSFGRGAKMRIRFAPGAAGSSDPKLSTNIGGIDSFELLRLEQLHLQFPPCSHPGPDDAGGVVQLTRAPVNITCRGPFRFNAGQLVATFEDQVVVEQPNPTGAADQIACDELRIKFTRRQSDVSSAAVSPPADDKRRRSISDLQPAEIRASGHPVMVRAQAVMSRRTARTCFTICKPV